MTRLRVRVALCLLGTAAPLPVLAQGERVATHLVTTNAIVIARPAAVVWPYIMEPGSWKQGNRLVHHAGPRGRTGERFAAVSAARPDRPDYFVENVEVTPPERRVIKLYAPDGTLIGFAAFVLTESGGSTTVRYDVYTETVISAAERARTTPAARAVAERADREASRRRFDAELQALKRLVEGS